MDVRIDKVGKDFEQYPAVHDVSLEIRSGELIALLGPSGSGKTTLLRLIAGLEQPTAGRILFGDEDGPSTRHVEIDLPRDHSAAEGSRLGFRPTRWSLFPAS